MDSSTSSSNTKDFEKEIRGRIKEIKTCVSNFVNACKCKRINCNDSDCCKETKEFLRQHLPIHSDYQESCQCCKHIYEFSQIHAHLCSESNCEVPFCAAAKNRNDTRSFEDAAIGYSKKKADIEFCLVEMMKVFVHSSQCDTENCNKTGCHPMKQKLCHMKNCSYSYNEKYWCDCKKLLNLASLHAKECVNTGCVVPSCTNIKKMGFEKLDMMLAKALIVKNEEVVKQPKNVE